MIFRELNNAKCKTYLLASDGFEGAVLMNPVKDRVERYLGVLAYHRLKLDLIVDTHTHADHRSGAHELSQLTGTPVAMHRRAPARMSPFILRTASASLSAISSSRCCTRRAILPTPISLYAEDRVFTGDCLLIHGTSQGRLRRR